MFTFLSGIWYYLQVPRREPRYQAERQKSTLFDPFNYWYLLLDANKARGLIGSTIGIYYWMQTKQQPAGILNHVNDTVQYSYVCNCIATKHQVLFIEALRLCTRRAHI